MSKNKKYRSDALAAVYETMEALHKIGAVDKQTMRRFNKACLTHARTFSAQQIKTTRKRP